LFVFKDLDYFRSSEVQEFRSSDITLFEYAGILGGSGRISYQSFYAPSPFGATPSSHEGEEITLYFKSSEVQKFRSSDITLFCPGVLTLLFLLWSSDE